MAMQRHEKLPCVSMHMFPLPQLCVPSEHSFTSEQGCSTIATASMKTLRSPSGDVFSNVMVLAVALVAMNVAEYLVKLAGGEIASTTACPSTKTVNFGCKPGRDAARNRNAYCWPGTKPSTCWNALAPTICSTK
eukprot:1655526-Rhodomonas_salina.1